MPNIAVDFQDQHLRKNNKVKEHKQSKLLNSKDLIAYFFVAGTGALVQLICANILQDWFNMSFEDATWPSYLISLVVGFVLTKLFAFNARQSQQTRREMVKFFMVAIFSGFVTDLSTKLAFYISNTHLETYRMMIPYSSKSVNVNELTCRIFGMGCSFVSNYILHKTFTFKNTGFYNRLKALIR